MTASGLWRGRPRRELILCTDPCHSRRRCPLVGRRKVAQDEWDARCTCPGAESSRRTFERSAEKRRETAAIFAAVDLSDHPDAETIERRLGDAFRAHGEQPPGSLTGMSRMIAAGTGLRGTRTPRLLWLGARAVGRAVRWAWQPDDDGDDRRSLRGFYGGLGALVGIAVLLTTAAARASGWRRLPWAVAALLVWVFTARTIAIGVLLTIVVRAKGGPAGTVRAADG